MQSALYAIGRLSVCLSHGWISHKWLKLGSCNFHSTDGLNEEQCALRRSVLALNSFAMDVFAGNNCWHRHDWGVIFGPHCFFSDLDFADDVAFLAELFQLLIPALETIMASEARARAKLAAEKNLSFGSREDEPSRI